MNNCGSDLTIYRNYDIIKSQKHEQWGNNVNNENVYKCSGSIFIYGYVLYHSVCRMKSRCSDKHRAKRNKKEIINSIMLWNLCMELLLDEISNKRDNIPLLKKYLNDIGGISDKIGVKESGIFERTPSEVHIKIPSEAIRLMLRCLAELNIDILNYEKNYDRIDTCIYALHNLPRCLLSPWGHWYLRQDKAIECSRYLFDRLGIS